MSTSPWIEEKSCYISSHEQNSPEWEALSFGRISAYWFSACAGQSFFKKKDEAIKRALEILPPPEENDLMRRGKAYERPLVEWFAVTFKVVIRIVGRAIPKWDHDIAASADALVDDDEILEVKVSDDIYIPLLSYIQAIGLGNRPQGYEHIFADHYNQMQTTMAVYGRNWSNYLVYGQKTNRYFHQKVPFDESYFVIELYEPVKLTIREIRRVAALLGIDLRRRIDPPGKEEPKYIINLRPETEDEISGKAFQEYVEYAQKLKSPK